MAYGPNGIDRSIHRPVSFFYHFNKGLSEISEKRYFDITKSIYKVLDDHLKNNKF